MAPAKGPELEQHTVAERLANAERELDAFERQPPLGAHAYLHGRNSRRAIILALREELTHDQE
jgi:hypothetical protein